ncbi:hypothetical protein JXA32_14290 [Candidatus Sumerlaeota bacterium]|nr:hypothetical protein [Candidatus Sumerlaeota bacterium]
MMSDSQDPILQQLEELKVYYANMLYFMEQSFALSPSASAKEMIGINARIQEIMMAIGPMMKRLQEQMLQVQTGAISAPPETLQCVNQFNAEAREATQILLKRLDQRHGATLKEHEAIKKHLIGLQQNHKALGAYKSQGSVKPRMLQSEI